MDDQALNQTANENKVKNDAAYKAWVQTHTPLQIKEANNARIHLLREAKAKNVKKLGPYRPIKDDRLPKKPTPSYAFFVADRVVSGDFKGLTKSESFALIGREWKALSAGERKVSPPLRLSTHHGSDANPCASLTRIRTRRT